MTAIDTFKTPLIQLTGTCYFNSVLNGILADPKLSRIFLYKVYEYKEELRKTDPTRYADFINTTGEALCPHPRFADKALSGAPSEPRFKEMRYIVMKYFYGFLCKGTEILEQGKTVDIADRMAKVIRKPRTETTEQDTKGGQTFKILLNILRTLYGSEFWDKVTFVEDMSHIPNEKAEILIHTHNNNYYGDSYQSVPKKRGLIDILEDLDVYDKTITVSIDKFIETVISYSKNLKESIRMYRVLLYINYLSSFFDEIRDIIATKNEAKADEFETIYNKWKNDKKTDFSKIYNYYSTLVEAYKRSESHPDKQFEIGDLARHSKAVEELFENFLTETLESYKALLYENLQSVFENGKIEIAITITNNIIFTKSLILFLQVAGYNVTELITVLNSIDNINSTERERGLINSILNNEVTFLNLRSKDIINDSAKNYTFSFILISAYGSETVGHAIIGKYYEGLPYIIDSNENKPIPFIDWKKYSDVFAYQLFDLCKFPCSIHVRSDLPPLSTADLKSCDIIRKTPFIQRFFSKAGGSQKRTIVYGGKKYRIQTGSKGGQYILVEGKKKYIQN